MGSELFIPANLGLRRFSFDYGLVTHKVRISGAVQSCQNGMGVRSLRTSSLSHTPGAKQCCLFVSHSSQHNRQASDACTEHPTVALLISSLEVSMNSLPAFAGTEAASAQ